MELWIKPIKGTTYGGESLVSFVQTAYMKQISEHNKIIIKPIKKGIKSNGIKLNRAIK